MRISLKSIISFLFKFSITFIILYLLHRANKLDFNVLLRFISSPKHCVLLLGCFVIAVFLGSFRWHLLVRAQGIKQTLKNTLQLNLIGLFFNTTLPGAVSGDVVKFMYMTKLHPGITKTKGFISMLVDRILGLSGLFILAFFGLFFLETDSIEIKTLALFVQFGFFTILLFFGFILSPFERLKLKFRKILLKLPLRKITIKVYDSLLIYQNKPSTIFISLLFSIIIHSIIVGSYFYVAEIMQLNANIGKLLLVVPMGLITTAIPVAPAGVGIGHSAFEFLLSKYGISQGANLFNVLVGFQILVNLSGGIFYLTYNPKKKKKIAEIQEENPC